MSVQIIDMTVWDTTAREDCWIERLKCYASLGLNFMEILEVI